MMDDREDYEALAKAIVTQADTLFRNKSRIQVCHIDRITKRHGASVAYLLKRLLHMDALLWRRSARRTC